MEPREASTPIMDEEDVREELLRDRNRLRAALARTQVHLMAGEYQAAAREVKGALDGNE